MKNVFFCLTIITLTATSCSKETTIDCYDEALYQKFKNSACLTDCPGVVGCDGNTYCNECEANGRGIRVVKGNGL